MNLRARRRACALLTALLATGVAPAAQDPAHPGRAGDTEHMDHDAPAVHDPGTGPPALPRTPIPTLTDVDRAAAMPPPRGHAAHDKAVHGYLLLDRLEIRDTDDATAQAWTINGWLGTDTDRLWLRSEGERKDRHIRSADLQLLYGRSITPWWDLVAGVRHDIRPRQARTFAALGVQGTAPHHVNLNLTAYLGEGGRTAARFEAHYEMPFTGRLILQWQVQADLYGRDDAARGLASGLSSAEAGARLRYEIRRRFAPYVGVSHERAFGDTAGLRRAAAQRYHETWLLAGLRTWF